MEDKKLTEQESLELITTMIRRTRERYIGDGNIMLMWGYLSVAVAALVWIMLTVTRHPAWNYLWFLIMIVGGILTPVMARKEQSERGMKSYSDRLTSQIWTVIGCTSIAAALMCVAFLLVGGVDSWMMMLGFALTLVPFAEIVQGIVVNEISMIVGGSIGLLIGIFTECCIAGHVTLYAAWFMPLFILAFAAMFIVPGHVINYKAKHQRL